MRRIHEGVSAPLDTYLAGVVRVRLYDAGLDDHLRGLGIKVTHQILDELQVAGHIGHDQVVGAIIDRDLTSWRQQVASLVLESRGVRIRHADESGFCGQDFRHLLLASYLLFQFLLQH